MVEEMKTQAILRAKEILSRIEDVAHCQSHMERVLIYSREIARKYPEADIDAIDLAVWWHDVGRLYGESGHASKSAEMARAELTKIDIDAKNIEKICLAISEHSNSEGVVPSTLEGKILKDADKLDFLTPSRWKMCIDEKLDWVIEIAIDKIPIIRNHILNLNESKLIFDVLLPKLKDFAKKEDSTYFEKYKEQVINLRVKE